MTNEKKTSRGWLALIWVFLASILMTGAIGNNGGLLLEPVATSLGMSRTYVSACFSTFIAVVNMLLTFLFAKAYEKIGLKKMIIIGVAGGLVQQIFMFLASKAGAAAPVVLLVSSFGWGLYCAWGAALVAPIIIDNWFPKAGATLFSLSVTIGTLSSTITAPIFTKMIMEKGWESTLLVRAIFVLIVLVFAIVFLKVAPGEKDAKIGLSKIKSDDAVASTEELKGLTLEEAKKTKKYYLLMVVAALIGLFAYPPMLCTAARCVDLGHAEIAGTMYSAFFAVSVVSVLPMGTLLQKFGCRVVLTIYTIFYGIGLFILSFEGISPAMILVSGGLVGFSFSMLQVPFPMLTKEAFGEKDFARIQSKVFAPFVIGMLLGGPLFNAFYDATGTYGGIFKIACVGYIVLVVFMFVALKKEKA